MKPIIPLTLLAFAILSPLAQAKTTTTLAQNQVVDGQPRIVIFQYDGKNAFCLQVPKKYQPNTAVGCFAEGDVGAINSAANGNLGSDENWTNMKDEGTEICYAGEGRCPVPAGLTDLLDPKTNKEWGVWRP
ncbi:hypothetical protein KGP17_15930 [Serratia sp. JSRIV001]|uniref:hypothetical protein n=1 Tax=unclassified Serratia (in: enterobacteria) TaxID=2647522 RepID=UPI001CC002E6|nr:MULTISPECIES: hypothetical protein [unclassified Serratia (in: enterobacteria)]UAN43967.1 hypothetical protein KGP17_15930 [Serratia sp. JSRIV001]UAN53521.1 hypothetical protein KGP26_10895 [Serratia sp. JSRIV002]UAN58142.1 hypothetical protein KGP21_03400 [Serratia sp. JSRIV004]